MDLTVGLGTGGNLLSLVPFEGVAQGHKKQKDTAYKEILFSHKVTIRCAMTFLGPQGTICVKEIDLDKLRVCKPGPLKKVGPP